MDDIFDDVDSILDAESASEEETTNFNESELHDIMSEIEDLEKEFEAEEKPMSLQEKIDAELAMELEDINTAEVPEAAAEVEAEAEAIFEEVVMAAPAPITTVSEIVEAPAQVLPFEKPSTIATTTTTPTTLTSSPGVSFQANGQMTLSLDFMVGQETAKLTIDPVKGLMVTLSGVELSINEDSGCTVSMDNGMKFTIPMTSSVNSLKKKSA